MHMTNSENRRKFRQVTDCYPRVKSVMLINATLLLVSMLLIISMESGNDSFLSLKTSSLLKSISFLFLCFTIICAVFFSLKKGVFVGGSSQYGRIAPTSRNAKPVQFWLQLYLLWPGVVVLCLMGAYHWLMVYLNA